MEIPNMNEEEEKKCLIKEESNQDVWGNREVNALLTRFLADILLWLKDNHYSKQQKPLNDHQFDILDKELTTLATVFWMGEVT